MIIDIFDSNLENGRKAPTRHRFSVNPLSILVELYRDNGFNTFKNVDKFLNLYGTFGGYRLGDVSSKNIRHGIGVIEKNLSNTYLIAFQVFLAEMDQDFVISIEYFGTLQALIPHSKIDRFVMSEHVKVSLKDLFTIIVRAFAI